ncbi:protein of unknown function [Pseudomonas inefficax]|uniref:Uncharacterized protein n=1 Tax=Pseudomonas inefficax TaxID=2078786 RepID=A0AAQ1SU85_9PSED|nr:protein of unknown function [Pseudomonas inefficax]
MAEAPVGAGLPANTGEAGAIHRVAFFAGKPAPTVTTAGLRLVPCIYTHRTAHPLPK